MLERVVVLPSAGDPVANLAVIDRAAQRGFRRFVTDVAPAKLPPGCERLGRRVGSELRLDPTGASTPIHSVGELPALEQLLDRTGDGALLAIEWTGDRVIPLEWAVARRGRRFRLWSFAKGPSEVPAALGALEHGADLAVVTIRSAQEIDELEAVVDRPATMALSWEAATVTRVAPAGLGDRVIVDTTSLLAADEGLLVGSAAAFLFHVASEAVGSAFSRPRPFRVNAGSAHSYVLMADGSTRYLSELGAGDAVLAVIPRGASRGVRVGRVKVERRPLSLISARVGDSERTLFAQEAETVRLSTPSGRQAVTELRVGADVLGVRLPAGRHLGAAVEETIDER